MSVERRWTEVQRLIHIVAGDLPHGQEDMEAAIRAYGLEVFDLGYAARLDCSTGRYGAPSPGACVHHEGERVCRATRERAQLEAPHD